MLVLFNSLGVILMSLSVEKQSIDEKRKIYAVYSGKTYLGSYGSLEEAMGVFQAFAAKLKVSQAQLEASISELKTAWEADGSSNDGGGNNTHTPPVRRPKM